MSDRIDRMTEELLMPRLAQALTEWNFWSHEALRHPMDEELKTQMRARFVLMSELSGELFGADKHRPEPGKKPDIIRAEDFTTGISKL